MNLKDFEHHIKAGLNQERLPVDTESLFEAIEPQLLRKKSKRRIPLLLLMVIVGVGLGLYINLYPKQKEHPGIRSDMAYQYPAENLSGTRGNEASSEYVSIEQESVDESENKTTIFSGKSENQSLNNAGFDYMNRGKSSDDGTVLNVRQPDASEENRERDKQSFSSEDKEKEMELPVMIVNSHSSFLNHQAPLQLLSLPLRTQLKSTSLGWDTGLTGGKIKCPDFKKKSSFLLELRPEAGYFLPFKTLGYPGSEPNELYLLRQENEKTLEGLQAGLSLVLKKDNTPFYLRVGAMYSRHSERMNLSYSYERSDTTQGIISITKSQNGDTLTVIMGDIINSTTFEGTSVVHHSFRRWDIPVAMGYERRKKNWTLGVELGLQMNVSLVKEGRILASENSFASTNYNNSFKSRLKPRFFGDVHVGYKIHPRWMPYMALRYIPQESAYTRGSAPVSQTYRQLGVNLGISYLIF